MKRNLVIATVAVAALAGGGTAVALANGDDDARTATPTTTTVHDGKDDDRGDDRGDDRDDRDDVTGTRTAKVTKVTVAQAIEAALESRPGTVVSVDLDDDRDDDGDFRGWEVDVLGRGTTSYTVQVDAATGKVVGTQTDRDDADDVNEARAALKGTSVDAREAADAVAPKGTVTDVDLDDDGRSAVWSVETPQGEWKVDAHTGKVTQDHDDRNGDDHDGDDD
ncbi:PepSY domain-containing protein [Streptomyces sp. TRM68416]|uniref:PepSY domain-containing protein n=1 Tax=Streptomyces sp. TRM68416 TaxID=2758412 RepID=UPI001661BD84|nr:PepSY domain-containing protein [Streptomyces sp. TRM68416]MBD0843209.1 PepSY domain-containing protein [Streptomyces sp. TRM68416]